MWACRIRNVTIYLMLYFLFFGYWRGGGALVHQLDLSVDFHLLFVYSSRKCCRRSTPKTFNKQTNIKGVLCSYAVYGFNDCIHLAHIYFQSKQNDENSSVCISLKLGCSWLVISLNPRTASYCLSYGSPHYDDNVVVLHITTCLVFRLSQIWSTVDLPYGDVMNCINFCNQRQWLSFCREE